MEIRKIPVASLNPAAYNPRLDLKPGDREYEKLRRSIEEFGYVEPVIWNERTGNVVGGHQRLKVMIDLGLSEIDCVIVDLDLPQEKALNIALNKIQGEWDETKLAQIMADFDAESFDVSLTGFDAGEVEALLNRFYSHDAVEDDFDPAAERGKIDADGGPACREGEMWRLGDHVLACGDPTDPALWDRLMEGKTAACAVSSPTVDPKEYAKAGIAPWLERMEKVAAIMAKRTSVVCWQVSDFAVTGNQYVEPMAAHSVGLFARKNFRPIWTRVWKMTGIVPTAGALQSGSNKPAPDYDLVTAFAGDDLEAYNDQEYAWVSAYAAHAFRFVRRLTRDERRRWGYAGVWEIAAMRRDAGGERMIPIELPWRCIKMHSDPHAIIADPFAGLGATLIACEQSGRACRAIESDPMRCALIIRRWEQFTGEKAVRNE